MFGGRFFWMSALLIVVTSGGASAGGSAHSGPLPQLASGTVAAEVTAPKIGLAGLARAAVDPARASLDLAAALKLGVPASECAAGTTGQALRVADLR